MPKWRRDGKEVFYLAPDSSLIAVEVQETATGLRVAPPQPLFTTNVEPARVLRNAFAASADGQRFLVMSPLVSPKRLRGLLGEGGSTVVVDASIPCLDSRAAF